MICSECRGEVDVPCYNGQRLRCGCGKTYTDPPAMDLDGLLSLLRSHGVSRYRAGELEIDLRETAPALTLGASTSITPAPLAAAPDTAETCACGHEVDAHTDAGCMNAGCDPAVCEEWAKKQAAA